MDPCFRRDDGGGVRVCNRDQLVTPAKAGAQTKPTDDVAARRLLFLRWVPACPHSGQFILSLTKGRDDG
jgi:hypothetical protein